MQYHDYCDANIDNFIVKLCTKLMVEPPGNFNSFYSTFNTQLDEACKLEQPKCTKRTVRNNPWITPGIIASVKTKHILYNKWKKARKKKCSNISVNDSKISKQDHATCPCYFCKSIISTYEKYKAHRKVLKHLITRAKQKFYGNKINECAGNSKKTWEIINDIRGKKRREIKPNFIIDNERITNRRLIANEFNKYFASIASDLNAAYMTDGIQIRALPPFMDYLPKPCMSSIYLRDCDNLEILSIISELKNGKSSAH